MESLATTPLPIHVWPNQVKGRVHRIAAIAAAGALFQGAIPAIQCGRTGGDADALAPEGQEHSKINNKKRNQYIFKKLQLFLLFLWIKSEILISTNLIN